MGTSALQVGMVDDGFRSVLNVDISQARRELDSGTTVTGKERCAPFVLISLTHFATTQECIDVLLIRDTKKRGLSYAQADCRCGSVSFLVLLGALTSQ